MSQNRVGGLVAVNVAAAVLAGRAPAVDAALAGFGAGAESPFARLGGVHFGRFVVLRDTPAQGREVLWMSVTADGTYERVVAAIRARMPAEAEAVWSHCAGWPGLADPHAVERFFAARRVDCDYFLAGLPAASVADVGRAVALRARVARFAAETQDAPPEGLRARVREAFR